MEAIEKGAPTPLGRTMVEAHARGDNQRTAAQAHARGDNQRTVVEAHAATETAGQAVRRTRSLNRASPPRAARPKRTPLHLAEADSPPP